ncbi:MAG: hypothetical protein M5R42_07185 [Rhodocyclaceae bacterium]|nr:hypothetical protein [Rhodocyclaceae bacterium]
MARYKHIDTSPRFLAVDLQRQLLTRTFEHALNHLVDHEIDLKGFDARYKNDLTGAQRLPAGDTAQVVLFAYSPRHRQLARHRARLPRSRSPSLPCPATAPRTCHLRRLCQHHWAEIVPLFKEVLLAATAKGFSGRDVRYRWRQAAEQRQQGQERHPCRLPRQADKMEAAAGAMLARPARATPCRSGPIWRRKKFATLNT